MSNLKEKYKKEIIPKLSKEMKLKSSMECPFIEKVVVNVGVGNLAVSDNSKKKELLARISKDISVITGQKPQVRPARKSISGFKLREGMPIGMRVTLRKKRMYDFLEKLINVALPRVRDFKGIKRSSVDGDGNITIGIKEQLVFPEISADDTDLFFGMEITIVTSTKEKEQGIRLLEELGVPFMKQK
ncbi:MAG: 50S ribosomal protein L5 [Candidatus Pacebacteria bacterium]|nr:50S ribosomal protein L5 [Candidatus Paceibacterota bacterium]